MGITPANVAASLKGRARGWVAEEEGVVVAFAIADGETRSIFALFVAPGYEGRGLGRALLDRAVRWLQSESSGAIWLTTAPDTRAAALTPAISGCQADMKRLRHHPNSSEEEHGIEPQRTNRAEEGARTAASSAWGAR